MKKITFVLMLMLITAFGWQANAQYCSSSFSNVTYEHVTNVTYTDINNSTGGNAGYNDYTAQIANVTQGESDQLSVTILADSNDYVYAFIDWDQNGTLNDTGEVYTLATAVSSPGPYTMNVTVPAGAELGNTRMRVMADWDGITPNPCKVATYGEVEDYTVNVQAAGGGGSSNFTVCGAGTPMPLGPNPSTASSAATVTDIGVVGPGGYTIDAVNLNVQHTWASDLSITLISPNGLTLNLSSNNGGNSGLDTTANLVFTDDSANLVTGWFSGSPMADYQPEGGLLNTIFAGEPTDGTWTLSVADGAFGDGGTLNSFCIDFGAPIIGNPPVISCPMDIMADNDPTACGAIVNFADAIAIDVEDGPIATVQTAGPVSGSEFPEGDTLVEFTATDSDGNSVTCSFTVTVMDSEAPIAVCQDITLEVDPATGTVSITAADIDNGSTDNCAIAGMSIDISSFNCSDVGPNTVTLTVTDTNGNSTDCTATVTIEDNTAPVITCIGQPGTVTVLEDFDAGLPGDWSTVINTGNCDWQNGTDMPIGEDFPTPAMFFDDDACGLGGPPSNVSLLSAVYDLTGATTAVLSYDMVYSNLTNDTFFVEVFDGTAWQQIAFYDTDITNIITETFDVAAYINPNFQVRWTFDDGGGWVWHAGVDNFILDYEVPATALDVVLDANGMASIDPADLLLSVDEACGYTVTAGGGSGSSCDSTNPSNGFTDGRGCSVGNGWTAANDVIVPADSDMTLTSIIPNIFMNPGATASSVLVTIYDDAGGLPGTAITSETVVPTSHTYLGSNFGFDISAVAMDLTPVELLGSVGVETTYWVAIQVTTSDGGVAYWENTTATAIGNPLAFSDGTPFIIPDPAQDGVYTFVANCSGSGGGLNFTCADLGENQIEVTVTDASGNVSTCIATVNVIDETAPVLVCADTTIELGPDGTAVVDPMAILATAPTTYNVITISSDNGSGSIGFTDLTVNVTEAAAISFDWDYTTADGPAFDSFGYLLNGVYTMLSNPAGGLNQSGTAAVAVSPGDVFGFRSQSEDGSFGPSTTTVSNFVPGFAGQFDPANWNLTLTNSDGTASFVEIPGGPLSFDACGITILAVDVTEVTCADIGTPIVVTVFASDASGNIASCQSTITVVDLLGPELTCPADQTVDPGAGNLFYILPDYFANGEATATDNCTDPVTIMSQDPAAGTPLPDGVHVITLSAEDEYGNVSTCTFELTIESILGADSNDLDAAIAMYPNPAGNQVTILNGSNLLLDNAVIFDINGKMVQKIDLRNMASEKTIDVSALAAGVYVVQITGEKASTVKRLIKE